MKKLLFGLLATIMLGFVGNAQDFTRENVEKDLIQGTISFYNSIGNFYKSGMSERDFYNALTNGQGFNNQSIEAKIILNSSYILLTNNATEDKVVKDLYKPFTLFTYKAIQLINDGDAESIDKSSTFLFGINSDLQGAKLSTNGNGPNGDLVFTDVAGCRWYQIGCHLKWLFGTEEGRKTLKSITDVMTIIIKFL